MRALLIALLACAVATPAPAAELSRAEAIRGLSSPQADQRREAVQRIGAVGRMQDAEPVLKLLFDPAAATREAAEAAVWRIWSRSGDARIDAMFSKGTGQMGSGDAQGAVATFSEIIRRKPDFAEGWNKRATVLFFLERYDESLVDCAEVIKRNPNHFGALAGYGQIYSRLDRLDLALEYFERALTINPNMQGVAVNVLALRKLLAERARKAI